MKGGEPARARLSGLEKDPSGGLSVGIVQGTCESDGAGFEPGPLALHRYFISVIVSSSGQLSCGMAAPQHYGKD